MRNSEQHHVWLAFANCQHEAKERIKYLPALRRRSNNPAAVLCSGRWPRTSCHPTGTARERQHPWPVQRRGVLRTSPWQKLLDCAGGIINISLTRQLLGFEENGPWLRWVCPFGAGGSAPRATETAWAGPRTALWPWKMVCKKHFPAPRPVGRGHRRSLRARSAATALLGACSWSVCLAGHYNPSCCQHT